MPKQEQTIPVHSIEAETALALSYEAMKTLKWTTPFAGPNKIMGSTPKKWNSYGQQIIIGVADGQLTISSEMVHGESFDIGGKNKKNIESFITAFNQVTTSANSGVIENNKSAIEILRAETIQAAELERQQTTEVNTVMNVHGNNLYATYAIMAINVIVFILMVINGAGLIDPNGEVHVLWGSNFTTLTLSGDWWRLLTCVFIHFGLIHIAMNMYCLYSIGSFLEPMLGKPKYIAAYLCTGVLSSLVSLWWHKEGVNSAGASGAVFGMYGLFLAMLTTDLIPKHVRQPLLQSIGIFIAFNLFYGVKGGVDNSAHIGGLLSGFIIGYLYVYSIKKERQGQKTVWMIPAIVLITIGIAYMYLQQHKVSDLERKAVLNSVKAASYKDNDVFEKALEKFSGLEDKALTPLRNDSLTSQEMVKVLDQVKPFWDEAEAAIKPTITLDISNTMHKKAEMLLSYIQLRKKENELLITLNTPTNNGKSDVINKELEATELELRKILDALKGL